MSRKPKSYKFNIALNLPTKENRAEYELRIAKAAAKILIEILPPEKVDELLENHKKIKEMSFKNKQ